MDTQQAAWGVAENRSDWAWGRENRSNRLVLSNPKLLTELGQMAALDLSCGGLRPLAVGPSKQIQPASGLEPL